MIAKKVSRNAKPGKGPVTPRRTALGFRRRWPLPTEVGNQKRFSSHAGGMRWKGKGEAMIYATQQAFPSTVLRTAACCGEIQRVRVALSDVFAAAKAYAHEHHFDLKRTGR